MTLRKGIEMKAIAIGGFAALTAGAMCSTAMAVGTVFAPNQAHSGSIVDRSSLYLADPAGGGGLVANASGVSGFAATSLGAEQRTIFSMDALNLGVKDFSKGLISVNDLLGGTPFTNGELKGIMSHLSIIAQDTSTGVVGPAGTNSGNLYFAPNGGVNGKALQGPRAEAAWTDTVASPNYGGDGAGGVGGDGHLTGGLATSAGGFGGRIQIWYDPTPGLAANGGPLFDPDGLAAGLDGQDQFIDGAAPGGTDLYPTINGDGIGGFNSDAVLVLDAVLTPVFNYAVGNAADTALLNVGLGGVPPVNGAEGSIIGFTQTAAEPGADADGGSISDIFVNATSLPADTVLVETFDETDLSGSGVGFMNIIGGDAAFISQFALDTFGPGRDIRFDFDLDIPASGVGTLSVDGWQVESDDPVQFLTIGEVPEPVTGGLGLMGMSALALYAGRRRR
jgi:hypothetical protein